MKILPKRALISVSDKSGIVEFAKALREANIEILSTGGSAKLLKENDIEVIEVADYTGFPEIMGGRLKTLHPKIHGGLLARRGIDETVMQEHDINAIDLLVVNLYPFAATIAKKNTSLEEAIENIDIGGPAMIRSAAKNHKSVTVVVDPSDYPKVAASINRNAGIDEDIRQKLALKAFRHTSDYDALISQYLSSQFVCDELQELFPQTLHLNYQRAEILRYGENPQQQAALYKELNSAESSSLVNVRIHQGKQLSFNNYADTDAALATVKRFEHPACVIVKHANPCGCAIGENVLDAYEKAYRCDPTSAFGGIIAFNRAVDANTASEIISRQFVEVIIAPDYAQEALQIFTSKPNIRVLELKNLSAVEDGLQIQSIHGGILLQEWDAKSFTHPESDFKTVSKREPTQDELTNLIFAWKVVQTVKSNAIVIAKDLATIGIGGGQTSRVFSSEIAAIKAQRENFDVKGAVLAGDAFFPFRDGVDAAAEVGVTAMIHPGGSIRDEEVIKAADEHGIAMIFTGIRHFRH